MSGARFHVSGKNSYGDDDVCKDEHMYILFIIASMYKKKNINMLI